VARRTHFSVEKLSEKGRASVLRGYAEKWTYQHCADEVKRATGETVSKSAVARYWARWKSDLDNLQASREQARVVLDAFRAGDTTAGETLEALAVQAMVETREMYKQADPIKLSREERERQKLRLKGEELGLRRREIDFTERKFEALQAKEDAAKEKMREIVEQKRDASGAVVLSEQQVKDIRGMYGL